MTRYRWRTANVAVGLCVYVLVCALGAILVTPRQQGGWVTLLMLLFIGACMATERGEWRWWHKLVLVPLLWVAHAILMLPVAFAFLPIVAASESLRLRADLVVVLIASVPIVLIAMRRSRWFVEQVEGPPGPVDLPWLWRALNWIFIGIGSLGYIGQATLFLLIEYAYISRNWVLIFHPLGPIIAFFTMLRLPVFWVLLTFSILGYLGAQWTERRMLAFGGTSSFPSS